MANDFTWIPIFQEIARQLVQWEGRQGELIAFLEKLRRDGLIITPLNDKDDKGARFLLKEIDPFTFMGVWNRGIRNDQRLAILGEAINFFGIQASLPTDFSGVPLLNNQKSWLFAYQPGRGVNDVKRLWAVFKLALTDKPLENPAFLKAFDEALEVPNTNINLTMGLFWIRPEIFLNLDGINREYLNIKLPSAGLNSEFYVKTVRDVCKRGEPLFEISLKAWQAMNGDQHQVKTDKPSNVSYWMVGAYWAGSDPQDQTQRFLEEGVWENGYDDRFLDEVKGIKVGDKIAIKAAITQKNNLPFDARGKTVSKMVIKAVGTVVANRILFAGT